MAIFPIRTFGDPVLRGQALPVDMTANSTERLVEDMFETMYDAPGVGLAAPQIGVLRQVFVGDVGEGPFIIVNPQLIETAGEWEFDEGCLSVPERFWPIKRFAYARVRGLDLGGNVIDLEGDELMGRLLQHEMDHLRGGLLLDHLSKRARKAALRELREESLGVRPLA